MRQESTYPEKPWLEGKSQGQTYVEWLYRPRPGRGVSVVNIKAERRRSGVRIDRTGLLGNPFRIGRDGTREEVLEKYRAWLRQQWRQGGAVKEKLLALAHSQQELTLLCWCAPLPCHGHIIAAAIKGIRLAEEKERAHPSLS